MCLILIKDRYRRFSDEAETIILIYFSVSGLQFKILEHLHFEIFQLFNFEIFSYFPFFPHFVN